MSCSSESYQAVDVVIVGAGPIGLSMCQALRGAGLSIALIEKQPQDAVAAPKPDGREIAITHRTRAIMQDLHQWQRLGEDQVHFLRQAAVYNGTSSFALMFDKPKQVHGRAVETLGYLISNHHIRQAAYDVLADKWVSSKQIQAFFGATVTALQSSPSHHDVTLDTGLTLRARLLIAADSRLSVMRKKLGIAADMHDFGRTVMVFRTQHTSSNNQTAHEGFYYGKTLAVLPLGEYQSSMVITVDNTQVDEIKSMSPERLAGEMMAWLGGGLGEMTVSSPIYDYPLLGVHAKRFYAQRAALIGDAAVGMHPVTAHGYNLGMESVALLGDAIRRAHQAGQDIGELGLLRRYHLIHSAKTRAIYHGTNAIVKLYTDERPAAKALRHVGLRMSDAFFPIKKLITAQLTG